MSKATLNFVMKILAFADAQVTSNPRLRYPDWLRDFSGVAVSDPQSQPYTILPGVSKTVFNNAQATAIDNTTAFNLTLLSVPSQASTYRLARVAGTRPAFRVDRGVAITGSTITFTMQANGAVVVNASVAGTFTPVLSGDTVFIPGTTTGDAASPFSVLNEGYWTVLAKADGQNITIARAVGQNLSAVGGTFTGFSADSQFLVFGPTGIQVGDSIDINSTNFDRSVRGIYVVTGVTPDFVEFSSSVPLPNQTSVLPTATGAQFYSSTRNFVYLESDVEVVVQVNGDVGSFQRVIPLIAGDSTKPGVYLRTGPTWSLVVYNPSAVTANVTLLHTGAA